MKHYAALGAALILTGCTLTPEKELQTQSDNYQPAVESATSDCVFQSEVPLDPARCDLGFWLDYWAQVDQMTWPKRESLIEQLGDSPDMLLQKVILSQPVNTPYKARLRAQHWVEQVTPSLSASAQNWLNTVVAKPSGHMLELESAVTILSNINNQQDKTLTSQEQQIQQLKAQLEALMNIESNLMNQEEAEQ